MIVHNGIIDNYRELQKTLSSEHKVKSETDTEVIVHLIEEEYKKGKDPIKSINNVVSKLTGSFALVVLFKDRPNEMYGIRKYAPLIIGTIIAVSLSFITPATENSNLFFVFICGIIGISGMMLPGLSGSYILILLGNYELLMVTAVTELDITLLSIFFLGSIFGLMSFSHLLS